MKKITLGILLLVGAGGLLSAEVFRFAYTKGEKYRLVSRVHESVTDQRALLSMTPTSSTRSPWR